MSALKTNKSRVSLLKIPSGEDMIVGRMFIAEGENLKATVLLLHGFPGTMMNLDIATELQMLGWNVLVINYRGSWGSEGNYSFANALEDVQTTLNYIQDEAISIANRIDVNRIALVGHSFGGFLALKTASLNPSIKIAAYLSGANFPLFLKIMEEDPASEKRILNMLDESSYFLKGATGESLMNEIKEHEKEWNTFLFAPTLTNKKLLITAVTEDEELPKEQFHDPFIPILDQAQISYETVVFDTDHNYTNKRKELTATLQEWLLRNL
ncbi:alpha/beta hydrolase family protein [Ureibacillus massiliensis]|uniref:alpha/beta hydrolase family protein n=1 Tax=Ureibacillus massiliensis TaxID=292806 RepID=UPI00068B21C3|nr:alpha/beta fold hydrolase [Ureibacillus massiliensis]